MTSLGRSTAAATHQQVPPFFDGGGVACRGYAVVLVGGAPGEVTYRVNGVCA